MKGKPSGMVTSFLWLFLILLIPCTLMGNGFDIYGHGAKAIGMGGAFTALADDPSCIAFNPAGLSQVPGTRIFLGSMAIIPSSNFTTNGNQAMGTLAGQSWTSKDQTWIVPSMFLTHRINERVSIGIGTYSPFGLGLKWPNDFEGRFTTGTRKTAVKTNSINPAISLKITDRLTVGIAPYAQHFDIEMQNYALLGVPVPPLSPGRNPGVTGVAKLTGNTWGYGVNGGLLFRISDTLSFGAAYMSQVRHKIDDGKQRLVRLSDGAILADQKASATVTLPASFRMGLVWKRNPWVIEIDGWWTEWSSYRTLRADFADGSFLEIPKNWHNTWYWRIGAQYTVNKYLDLRAGFNREESPVPRWTVDPLVPAGTRLFYAVGLGIHLGTLTIDLAYNYIQDQSIRWNNSAGNVNLGSTSLTRVTGRFDPMHAHLISGAVSYQF